MNFRLQKKLYIPDISGISMKMKNNQKKIKFSLN